MPIYLYRCEDCGTVVEVEMGMLENHPDYFDDNPEFFATHSSDCTGRIVRQFTIPGMTVIKTEEDGGWNIRAPGEVSSEQRNKKYRDRFMVAP